MCTRSYKLLMPSSTKPDLNKSTTTSADFDYACRNLPSSALPKLYSLWSLFPCVMATHAATQEHMDAFLRREFAIYPSDVLRKMSNCCFDNGCTPLHVAIAHGRAEVAEKLLKMGASLNDKKTLPLDFILANTWRHPEPECVLSVVRVLLHYGYVPGSGELEEQDQFNSEFSVANLLNQYAQTGRSDWHEEQFVGDPPIYSMHRVGYK